MASFDPDNHYSDGGSQPVVDAVPVDPADLVDLVDLVDSSSATAWIDVVRRLRLLLAPFLPPPVLSLMRSIDEYFVDVTEEASAIILLTLLAARIVLAFVRALWRLSDGRSATVDDDGVLAGVDASSKGGGGGAARPTVVLCGPAHAGKTVLFHALCRDLRDRDDDDDDPFRDVPVATVTSLAAADREVTVHGDDDDDRVVARLLDHPGHASLRGTLPDVLVGAAAVVLVLDAARPVADAADVLWSLLTDPRLPWNDDVDGPGRTRRRRRPPCRVLVACHKADAPSARNPRRIRLQLRAELERLRRARRVDDAPTSLGAPGKPLDLDDERLSCRLEFAATTCRRRPPRSDDATTTTTGVDEGWRPVREFVRDVARGDRD